MIFLKKPRQRHSPEGASCPHQRDSPQRCWRLPPPDASHRLEHKSTTVKNFRSDPGRWPSTSWNHKKLQSDSVTQQLSLNPKLNMIALKKGNVSNKTVLVVSLQVTDVSVHWLELRLRYKTTISSCDGKSVNSARICSETWTMMIHLPIHVEISSGSYSSL